MKQIILMRHGKAETETAGLSDFHRALTSRGNNDAILIGKYLKKQGYNPQIIAASSSARTTQTAYNIAQELNFDRNKILLSEDLYLGYLEDILQVINEFDESCEIAIIVGHNPTIAEVLYPLVKRIKPEIFDFPTLCTGILTFNGTWNSLEFAKCQAIDFFTPKTI